MARSAEGVVGIAAIPTWPFQDCSNHPAAAFWLWLPLLIQGGKPSCQVSRQKYKREVGKPHHFSKSVEANGYEIFRLNNEFQNRRP